MKILDIGCGGLNNKYHIYDDENETIGVDIDEDNVESCKKQYPHQTFLCVDGEALPFEDESFDRIHSLDVFEHVDDLDAVMQESTRVLKKGGIAMIEVPYWKSEERFLQINPRYWDKLHHVRMFYDGDMEKLFEKFGYIPTKMVRLKYFDNVVLGYFLKYGDIKNQKGEIDVSKYRIFVMKLRYGFWYCIYKLFPGYFDNKFPKSIYFEFQKQ